MSSKSARTVDLQSALEQPKPAPVEVMMRYGVRNPRVFGPVTRGDARAESNIDVLVGLTPDAGNDLLRIAGPGKEFSQVLGVRVDFVSAPLPREPIGKQARLDAIALRVEN